MGRRRVLVVLFIILAVACLSTAIAHFLSLGRQQQEFLAHPAPESPTTPPNATEAPAAAAQAVAEPAPESSASDSTYLAGRVLDEEGKPVEADLFITSEFMAHEEKTDTNGMFRASGLPRGTHFAIYVRAEGFIEQTRMDIPPDSDHVDFVMVRGATIVGEVRYKLTGELVPTFSVHLAKQGRIHRQPRDFEGGRFRISGLECGEYEIMVHAIGCSPQSPEIVNLSGKDEKKVQIRVTPYAQISGFVLFESDRTPVEGARIWIDQIGNEGRVYGHGLEESHTTDAHGAFLRVPWKTGKLTLFAVHDGFATGSVTVEVAEGQKLTGVEILLRHGAILTGTVRDKAGNPLARILVVLTSRRIGSAARKEAFTGEDGRFSFSGLSPDVYVLRAGKAADLKALPDLPPGMPREILNSMLESMHVSSVEVVISEQDKEKSVDVKFEPGEEKLPVKVHGTVRRKGVPVAGCEVSFQNYGTSRQVTTDDEGRYQIRDLPAGDYEISFGKARKNVSVPRVPEFLCDLEIPQGAIEGRVIDASTGESISWANVFAILLPDVGGMHTTRTDMQGRFRFEDLEEGTYDLSIQRKGYEASNSLHVRAFSTGATEPIVVRLEKGAILVVRCLNPQGEPAVGISVALSMSWKGESGFKRSQEIFESLGEEGTIRNDELPAGPVEVWVTSHKYACFHLGIIEIVKGAPNHHEIRFTHGGTLKFHVVGAEGLPLCGARIKLFFSDGNPLYISYSGAFGAIQKECAFNTDTDGNCTCERVHAGQIRIHFEAEGHAKVVRDLSVEDLKETSLTIDMKKS